VRGYGGARSRQAARARPALDPTTGCAIAAIAFFGTALWLGIAWVARHLQGPFAHPFWGRLARQGLFLLVGVPVARGIARIFRQP
jgi:hypothetical protein